MAACNGDGDDEQRAEAVPNQKLNSMLNHLTRGLLNDYREANGFSTEASSQDGDRKVH